VTSSLTAGNHPISAVYGGDTNYTGSTSPVLNQTVNAPEFAIACASTWMTVARGQSGTMMMTVTPKGVFNQTVSFACSNLPVGVACSFTPATVMPQASPATTALTVTAAPTAAKRGGHGLPWTGGIVAAICWFGLGIPRRRKLAAVLLMALVLALSALLAGCGFHYTAPGQKPQPVVSVITVTATAGTTVQHSMNITLTLQ
ncbi:MAG: Ig-like domain-containing protein, partial [Acidobacteriia bacterium]|nr:Ig-like domain-containing protein [Terriglobia bacterium]